MTNSQSVEQDRIVANFDESGEIEPCYVTWCNYTQQLSLGLVIPSLELTRWRTRQPHTSIPVVYTTLKMVVRRRTRHAADDVSDDNVTSEWHHVNRRRHPSLNSRCVWL